MEKFGVDQEPVSGHKQASDQDICPEPDCGRVLTKIGKLRLCPMHGSKPFERPHE